MDDQIHVQSPSSVRGDKPLDRVVQTAPAIHRPRRENAGALQNAERVAIHRERVSVEAVEENAASRLPRESGKPRQDSLGIRIAHPAQKFERELAAKSVNSY